MITGQIQAIEAELSSVDTLTLRREENEEIWERNRKLLNTYTKVEFLPEGTWSRDPETRKVELEKYERKLAKRAYTPLKAEFAEDCEAPF